jgi:hypothetical protein
VSEAAVTTNAPPVPTLRGLRRLGAASLAGAVAGLVVGGIGGRLAMLLLRLTSDATLHGLKTDDGFTIGIVSGDTGFLLTLTLILGAAGGAVYLGIRSLIPERARPWVAAALGGTIGGAGILRPGGIDFTLLEPLPLAVILFVAIPALGAAATSVVAERFLARGSSSTRNRWLLGLAPLVVIGAIGPTALVVVAVVLLLAITQPRLSEIGAIWASEPATWIGRGALGLVGAFASIQLVQDVIEIL